MNIEAIKLNNEELFWDGVSEGAIDYSNITGLIPVGAGQPNPTISSFIGGPFLPVNNVLPKSLMGATLGASGNYPRPFLSWSQRMTNANYSYIGAYARLIKFQKPDYSTTCINGDCEKEQENTSKNVWGRVGIIPDGLYSGQWGFFAQPWYQANDGQYDAAFWADRYDLEIPDKPTWWDQCSKTTLQFKLYNSPLRYDCIVEIAIKNIQFDDNQYYKGEPLHSIQDGTLELLPIMTGLVSAIGWI